MRGIVIALFAIALGSCKVEPDPLIERVAKIEHQQWMTWSKAVAPDVTPERRKKWQKHWVPYEQLPEDIKELDRHWARKAIAEVRREKE